MANKITCKYCGAEINEMVPECPYCGSTNYIGAEAEYFEKLEDVREDMEELEEVPEEEIKKEFRKQGKFLKIVFLIIGVIVLVFAGLLFLVDHSYERDEKKDFLWKQENYPIMDEMYEQGKYDELVEFYVQAGAEDSPVWSWEHSDFCSAYVDAYYLQQLIEKETSGKELDKYDYVSILYHEMWLIGIPLADFDENERELLAGYVEWAQDDFDQRWNMTEEEKAFFYDRLEENRGWVEYEYCEDYIEKWYENH